MITHDLWMRLPGNGLSVRSMILKQHGEYKSALAKVCTKEQASFFLKRTEEFDRWLRPKIK